MLALTRSLRFRMSAAFVLLVVLVVLYNVRTRALHRHKPYAEMWEWLLWTSVVTYATY